MKYFLWLLRIALGGLFIFSGLVKANDPLGLTYKMNEIFELWGMHSMVKFSEAFAIGMIALEVIAGVAMFVGNAFRFWIMIMVLMNVFFLGLTWYAWSSGKVKECGCFGDCFKLSNSETFYKDVALTAIAIFLWIFRYRVFPLFNNVKINVSVVVAATVMVFGFQWWVLHHLPVYDCLPYKTGNNLWDKMQPDPNGHPAVYENLLVYQQNGVNKEFTEQEFNKKKIWEDKSWKFIEMKSNLVSEATDEPAIRDFALMGMDDKDYTKKVLQDSGYVFIFFVSSPDKAHMDNVGTLRTIIDKAASMKLKFFVACNAGNDLCKTYKEVWNMKDVTFFKLDGTVAKTVMRTNPGLMLLKGGVVVKKWSYLDYPKDIVLDNGILTVK